jgi:hypothetical protein
MSLKIFLPMGKNPPDEFIRGHSTSQYQPIIDFPFYLLWQIDEEDLTSIGLTPSYATSSFTAILAGNATSPSTTTYNGTLHHQLIVIIWIDTGPSQSPTVDDGTLVEDSKLCWNSHANNATSSSTVHLIITQFTATDATTTAFAAASTLLIMVLPFLSLLLLQLLVVSPLPASLLPSLLQLVLLLWLLMLLLFMSDLPLQQ